MKKKMFYMVSALTMVSLVGLASGTGLISTLSHGYWG
jgi:hypothetical protein